MRKVGYGRPGTKVFPDDWGATHGKVIEGTLECVVAIGPRSGAPAWNETTGQTETPVAAAVYAGDASLSPVTDTTRTEEAAADVVPTIRYQVTLPVATAGIDPEAHVVKVTTSPDPMLTGRILSIDGVVRGGRRFSRILFATLTD